MKYWNGIMKIIALVSATCYILVLATGALGSFDYLGEHLLYDW
jgi:hypothetical protein